MFFLEKFWLGVKLFEYFKIIKDFTNVDAIKLFSFDNSSRTRSNDVKLRCQQVELDKTKLFFTYDVRKWNKLSPSLVI